MFTVEQLKSAHSKVKSGADFPAYIQEIKSLGVTHYQTYVNDGHTDYYGEDNYIVNVPKKYEPLKIAESPKIEEFQSHLVAHQQGETDYLTFINMSAEMGINKWEICLDKMTCTYYDKAGQQVFIEQIPQ